MHKHLQKQLKKLGFKDGRFPDGNLEKFIELVNTTYIEADEDRAFLEHTLETSSQEMEELYEELKQKSQTALAKSEQKYKELATKDMLTGILNRFAFEDELNRIISNSKRTGTKFALLFLDLDHFKEVNDTYGHDIGDKLLVEVAKRVVANIRAEDIFARIGGDEFVILFTNIENKILPALVNKAISLFRKPWIIDDIQLNVTTSIGVVVFPDDADDKIKLMKKADIAMYRSKESGRNQVVYFKEV
ncbi:diguanylate cyclase/phosphodiesterase (GGDEF & EAL domains) with PAS/PAC sensor(s) [hydrothermal vent metagenome]|uniref:Diguanylate cyclase/phosphodiesterase (GGDEF & EAL domains) with PAS/PAC sensor(S) n=1 Tax=hydrothermal vent metagenome TaxID=652676 RepID=A0A1W1BG40_9ZZZZ